MSQRYTDDHLLAAARACVAERGIARTTVSDVARRAGASRMTVYRAFPDAASLWSTLLTREVAAVIADAEAAAATQPNARARLVAAVLAAVRALRDDPVIRRVVERDGDRLLPYLTTRRGHAQELAITAISERLAEGRRDGSIGDVDPAAAPRVLELVIRSFVAAAPDLIDDALTSRIDAELGRLIDAWLRPA